MALLPHTYYLCLCEYFFFFKQKTAYEMRISDWSSDVCSSDLSSADLGPSAGGALTSSADSISSDALTGACCISASREQPESAIRMAIANAQADLITTSVV